MGGGCVAAGRRVQEPSADQPPLSEDAGSAGDLHGGACSCAKGRDRVCELLQMPVALETALAQ